MEWLRLFARIGLGIFFLMAGRAHFQHREAYIGIVPPWLPAPGFLVDLSGVLMMLGGAMVFIPRLAPAGGWLLAAVLIAVFPANIYMAVSGVKFHGFPSQPWMAWARLPLQGVLIWWSLWSTR